MSYFIFLAEMNRVKKMRGYRLLHFSPAFTRANDEES